MAPNDSDSALPGPYAVGVLQTTFEALNGDGRPSGVSASERRRLPTEIWYPAAPNQRIVHDADHPLGLPHLATIGLKPRQEPTPLIVFSHGNSGLRQQSTFLMTHLASWGYTVVAPDHLGNTFNDALLLETEADHEAAHRRARAFRPTDLIAPIRGLIDEGAHQHDLPPLHADRIGALGHSFGGWTALKATGLEPRIRALCCLAPVSEPFVGRNAFSAGELPLRKDLEALILAAGDDVLVDLETSIKPLHERLGPLAQLEVLDGLDHFHFCDGIAMLHQMHLAKPRDRQHRPTKPLDQLRGESETHTLLRTRVTRFFDKQFQP